MTTPRPIARLLPVSLLILATVVVLLGQRGGSELPGGIKEQARIVSLAPSITEILFAIGAGDQVVGVTRYCDYPPQVRHLPRVGGLSQPNLEVLYGLRPTLVVDVVGSDQSNGPLADLGLDVLEVPTRTVEEILSSITTLGEALHHEAEAATVVEKLRSRMASMLENRPPGHAPTILVAVGGHSGSRDFGQVFVAGSETFYAELIALAGGRNALPKSPAAYPRLTAEGLLALDPDIVIDLVPNLEEYGWSAARLEADWRRLFADTVGRRQIRIFAEPWVVRPGPRFLDIVDKIARAVTSWSEAL